MPLTRALNGETVVDQVHDLSGAASSVRIRVRVSARPLRESDGGIRGAIIVFTEV